MRPIDKSRAMALLPLIGDILMDEFAIFHNSIYFSFIMYTIADNKSTHEREKRPNEEKKSSEESESNRTATRKMVTSHYHHIMRVISLSSACGGLFFFLLL